MAEIAIGMSWMFSTPLRLAVTSTGSSWSLTAAGPAAFAPDAACASAAELQAAAAVSAMSIAAMADHDRSGTPQCVNSRRAVDVAAHGKPMVGMSPPSFDLGVTLGSYGPRPPNRATLTFFPNKPLPADY